MSESSPERVVPNPHTQVLQANERTVLAWIRTGLAIMAFGFVVARIGLWLRQMGGVHANGNTSVWIGAGFIVLGITTHLIAAKRYIDARKAILEGRSVLPATSTILFVVFSLTVLGSVLLTYLLTQ